MLDKTSLGQFADQILKNDWVKPNKRIFNNAKVSDHFAIIPTTVAPKHLSEPEAKLYDLVTKRFLAVFFPAAEFLVTTRITRVEGEPFKTGGQGDGERGLDGGLWQGRRSDDTPSLVPVQPNGTAQTANVEVQANQTRPPPRWRPPCPAMEGRGKLVYDENLPATIEKGLVRRHTRNHGA